MTGKRRKLDDEVPPEETEDMSYDEIWDDSALINDWDAAVEEYKHYYSLHARGEDVEAILDDAEIAEETEEGSLEDDTSARLWQPKWKPGSIAKHDEEQEQRSVNGPVDADEALNQDSGSLSGKTKRHRRPTKPADGSVEEQMNDATTGGTIPYPGDILDHGPVQHDEALKQLMMSWYWAGYYSGFYEGQRSAGDG